MTRNRTHNKAIESNNSLVRLALSLNMNSQPMPNWQNDEGYADDDPRPDSRMRDINTPQNAIPPTFAPLPDYIAKMPEPQRTGTYIFNPSHVRNLAINPSAYPLPQMTHSSWFVHF